MFVANEYYFVDNGDTLSIFVDPADGSADRLDQPPIPKHDITTVELIPGSDAVIIYVNGQAKTARGNMDWAGKYSEISTAKIDSNGGAVADGYPDVTSATTLVSWLKFAIWGGGGSSGGSSSGSSIEDFTVRAGTDWRQIRIEESDGTTHDLDPITAGYRQIAISGATSVGPLNLPAGARFPWATGWEVVPGGYQFFQVSTLITTGTPNQVTVSWGTAKTGIIQLQ